MGNPPGAPWASGQIDATETETARQYVRDPDQVLGSELVRSWAPSVQRPSDATDSGFSVGEDELCTVADDSTAVYVVGERSTERWARTRRFVLCA